MPLPRLTAAMLSDAQFDRKGSHLVVELLVDHHQFDLPVVPAGTRAIATSVKAGQAVCVFPFESFVDTARPFIEGHLRIVPVAAYKPLGRTTPKKR